MIITIKIIMIITNKFVAFELNFLPIFTEKIKKAVEEENIYIGPSAFT